MTQATHIITPGSLVIWGTFDRPCARMIAMVIKMREVIQPGGIRQSISTLRYVAARPDRTTFNREQDAPTDDLQPIEHFAVDWYDTLQDGTIIMLRDADPVRPVVATYEDGKPRSWQGHHMVAVAPDLWRIIGDRHALGSPLAF